MHPGNELLLLLCVLPTCLPGIDQANIVILENQNLDHIPKGLNSTIIVLSLSHNDISGVGLDELQDYKQLQSIKLHHNLIYSSKDLFGLSVVRSLLYLDLSHNYMRTFNFEDFRWNSQLRTLKLSHNHKLNIARQVGPLPNLEKLILVDCSLGNDFPWEIFEGFPALTHLDLQLNRISAYPERVFDYLRELRYLDLSSNNIMVLDFYNFNWNLQLRTLNFCHNQNLSIAKHFGRLDNLQIICLKNCGLDENIPWEIFENLLSLVKVDLRHNNISRIPHKVFALGKMLLDKHVEEVVEEPQNVSSLPTAGNMSAFIAYSVFMPIVMSVLAMNFDIVLWF